MTTYCCLWQTPDYTSDYQKNCLMKDVSVDRTLIQMSEKSVLEMLHVYYGR